MLWSFIKKFLSPDPLVKPRLTHLSKPSVVIRQELEEEGIRLLYGLLDEYQTYHFTTDDGWQKVADYIYKAFKFPKYVDARKDCDFFAILFVALSQSYFGLNGCGLAIGPSPEGQHAFVRVRSNSGWWLWEPNPDFGIKKFFRDGDYHGYKTQVILI